MCSVSTYGHDPIELRTSNLPQEFNSHELGLSNCSYVKVSKVQWGLGVTVRNTQFWDLVRIIQKVFVSYLYDQIEKMSQMVTLFYLDFQFVFLIF